MIDIVIGEKPVDHAAELGCVRVTQPAAHKIHWVATCADAGCVYSQRLDGGGRERGNFQPQFITGIGKHNGRATRTAGDRNARPGRQFARRKHARQIGREFDVVDFENARLL